MITAGDRFVLSFSATAPPAPPRSIPSEAKDRQTDGHAHQRAHPRPPPKISSRRARMPPSSHLMALRVSARLYLPAVSLGFQGPRPLVYYIHGAGPQGQERPDFAWFSMPLIQFLALRGFAVLRYPTCAVPTGLPAWTTPPRLTGNWGGQGTGLEPWHVHAHDGRCWPKDSAWMSSAPPWWDVSYGGYMDSHDDRPPSRAVRAARPAICSARYDVVGLLGLHS